MPRMLVVQPEGPLRREEQRIQTYLSWSSLFVAVIAIAERNKAKEERHTSAQSLSTGVRKQAQQQEPVWGLFKWLSGLKAERALEPVLLLVTYFHQLKGSRIVSQAGEQPSKCELWETVEIQILTSSRS